MKKKSFITVTDQFCGAGGSSIGAVKAGAELRLALNHWRLAVDTHNTNFPQAAHDCTDISACDPRRYPTTDILITSPECTNHSLANGKRKPSKQFDMFNPHAVDPAEERSRATMWDVPRFAEYHDYRMIVVENVVDARKWVMWDAWLMAMHALGYEHQCVYFNSMHAHPTPQSRDRMYVVFWKRGHRRPNLDITPRAHCHKCGCDVDSVQSWKPGRAFGRYRKQYVYCCPKCASVVEPYYYCAFNAIDWSLPAQRIGDRKKPLKDATLRRVRIGLEKFAGAHLLAMKDSAAKDWALGLHEPMTTQVASSSQHALITPFLIDTQFTHSRGDRSADLREPMHTQTAQQSRALVVPPFITSYYAGGGQDSSIEEPMPTLPTRDRHAVVVPPFIVSQYNRPAGIGAAVRDLREPMPTVPAMAVHHVVTPPFIINQQANTAPTAMHEAMATLLASGNHKWLVEPGEAVQVEDCGFRMLEPEECGAAMAFPSDYKVLGGKRDRVKQYGNAVTPPVMDILMQRCMEALR
jgi:DNA (cytosine-5)-methyltransferase 1